MRMPKLAELVEAPFVGPLIAGLVDVFGITDDDLPDIVPGPDEWDEPSGE